MNYTTYTLPKTKTTVSVPSWVKDLEENAGNVDEINSYNLVPLVFRAVNLRCNSLASTPIKIMRGDTEKDWPFDTNLMQLIWKTEAALLLSGSAFWLKRANKVMVKDLQWLNPFAMEVKRNKDTGKLTFKQTIEGGQEFTEDDIVYFHEFAPQNDLTSGTATTSVALGNSKLLKYMTDFAGEFFRNGAMPTTIVHVPSGTAESEIQRTENFFRRAIGGVKRAFRVLAIQGGQKGEGLDVQTVTHPIKDLAMPELKAQSLESVAHAFGIPETMLTDAANYATAQEHRMSFWQDTIRPRAEVWIAPTINAQLLKEMGLKLTFAFDEMDIFQEDETKRAQSYKNYVDAGMPPSVTAQILGIDLPEGITPESLDEIAKEFRASQKPVFNQVPNDQQQDTGNKNLKNELRAWRKFAINRIGKGARKFETKFIPASLCSAIQGALEIAKDEDAINRIFDDAGKWERYP